MESQGTSWAAEAWMGLPTLVSTPWLPKRINHEAAVCGGAPPGAEVAREGLGTQGYESCRRGPTWRCTHPVVTHASLPSPSWSPQFLTGLPPPEPREVAQVIELGVWEPEGPRLQTLGPAPTLSAAGHVLWSLCASDPLSANRTPRPGLMWLGEQR